MKKLTETQRKKVSNAWGRDVIVENTDYEIESSDVGTVRMNHNGNQKSASYNTEYKFVASDVGRKIRVDSAPDGCWYFI